MKVGKKRSSLPEAGNDIEIFYDIGQRSKKNNAFEQSALSDCLARTFFASTSVFVQKMPGF
jgi:hypothetical protein